MRRYSWSVLVCLLVNIIGVGDVEASSGRGTNSASSSQISLSPLKKSDVVVGSSREDVVNILGQPKASVSADMVETLIYERGDVVLESGVVSRVNLKSYAVHVADLAAAGGSSGKDGEKKPWYSAISGMFKGDDVPAAPPVTSLNDLAPRYTGTANRYWKVLFKSRDGQTGQLRVEGPEGAVTQGGKPFMDRDCQCRLAGNQLEIEYLSYQQDSVLTWVKMFTIKDRDTLISNDPNLFRDEMLSDETLNKKR